MSLYDNSTNSTSNEYYYSRYVPPESRVRQNRIKLKKRPTVLERRINKYIFYIPNVFKERQIEVMCTFMKNVYVDDIIYISEAVQVEKAKALLKYFNAECEVLGWTKDEEKVRYARITKCENGLKEKKTTKFKFDVNELVL